MKRILQRASSPVRRLPDFVVIGGIRCGTTSLFEYLDSQQETRLSSRKELHYFDWNFDRGTSWYRSWFPVLWNNRLTGEATPSYLMDPNAPARAHETIPNAKFIVLLRDPVDRAISHFNLRRQEGHEACDTLSAALDDEPNRIGVESSSHRLGRNLDCYYLQGDYARGLERWFQYFDRDQFCIVASENLFEEPEATYKQILDFLELEVKDYPEFVGHNAAHGEEDDSETAALLRRRYESANQELYELIGIDFGW